jgi:hypothetical protein
LLARGELRGCIVRAADSCIALLACGVATGGELVCARAVDEVEAGAAEHREDQVGDERVQVQPARAAALDVDQCADRLGQLGDLLLRLAALHDLVVQAAAEAFEQRPALRLGGFRRGRLDDRLGFGLGEGAHGCVSPPDRDSNQVGSKG